MKMEENTFGDFYKEEFDIDEFLNKQTETNELKEILYSLNEMKNKNSNKMTTVLREKTDAVILIAEQLQSLYKKIDNLQSPLAQLKEEVQIIAQRVNETVNTYDKSENHFQHIKERKQNLLAIKAYKVVINQTQVHLEQLMNQDDVDFESLERLVCKYAFHAFMLKQLNVTDSDLHKKPSIDVSIKLILRDTFLKSHSSVDANKVTRVIDMFVYLNMLDVLKEIVCDDIIKPKVEGVFCEENLRACGNDMGLVYGQALRVLEHDLKLLITIIRNENIPLDIILDCYWSVVDKLLRTNLITITAAGHPDAFFKHFNHTHQFLQDIGVIYGNRELYKSHHSFIEHLKRFNLLVYYEIRHQYVSSSYELIIFKCSEFSDVDQLEKVCKLSAKSQKSDLRFKLKSSLALNLLVEYLFSEKVFMSIISEQFAKSALLLTSRFSNWVQECLMISLKKYPRSSRNVHVAVCLISDLQLLSEILPKILLKLDDAVDNTIRSSLEEKLTQDFANLYKEVADYLINYHLDKMKDDLKNVSDIPRLYRKTNRSVPQQASSYVKDAFKDVEILNKTDFCHAHQAVLLELLQSATKEYNSMVHSVLNAVFKTEESLKRLKSRNVANTESGMLQGSSDEAKIRLQIKLDVKQFVEIVQGFKLGKLEADLQGLLAQIENY